MTIGFDASRSFKDQPTGTETYSHELLKALLTIDRKNTYRLYLRDEEKTGPRLRREDKIEQLVGESKNVEICPINVKRLWTQFGLAKEVFLRQPDVLFVPAHTLPVIHRPGLKSVVTIHDLGAEFLPEYHKWPHKLYLNRSTEYAVKHATHLIAVSESTKRDLIQKLGANPYKISVVYEGYDKERFHQIAEGEIQSVKDKYGLQNPYLLFVGTVQPRKNLLRLIEAFSKVSSFKFQVSGNMRELSQIELVLVGKKGWLADEIYQAPEKFGVADKVRFIDFVDSADLSAIYAGATAFVFPSLFEGFGLPVLEAMACGIPVLTSTSSSLPEVAGEAAVLIDPTDVDSMAQGLIQIVTNNQLRESLKQTAKVQIQKFSWQQCALQTLTILEKIAQ